MKKLIIFFALILVTNTFLTSCSSTSGVAQGVSNVLPTEEATALAETMASQLGLNTTQKSSVYTSVYTYLVKKRDLVNQVKNNSITQAAVAVAESKLSSEKNASIKAVLNNAQLKTAESLFGIK